MSEENQTPTQPPEKLGLTSNREVPLSLFVYIIREGYNNVVPTPQNVSMITAYTNEDALAAVRKQFPTGMQLTVEQKGQITMKQVLEMFQKTIDLDGTGLGLPVTPAKAEPDIIARTKKDFYKEIVEGMLKDLSPFVDNPVDIPVLEKALKKMLSIVQ